MTHPVRIKLRKKQEAGHHNTINFSLQVYFYKKGRFLFFFLLKRKEMQLNILIFFFTQASFTSTTFLYITFLLTYFCSFHQSSCLINLCPLNNPTPSIILITTIQWHLLHVFSNESCPIWYRYFKKRANLYRFSFLISSLISNLSLPPSLFLTTRFTAKFWPAENAADISWRRKRTLI